jgi:hypothetical protein
MTLQIAGPDPVDHVVDDLPGMGASPAGPAGGLGALMMGSDAETELVRAIVSHRLRLSGRALRAAVFLNAYGLAEELALILTLRRHLGSAKELVASLDSVALKKFMSKLEIKLGS